MPLWQGRGTDPPPHPLLGTPRVRGGRGSHRPAHNQGAGIGQPTYNIRGSSQCPDDENVTDFRYILLLLGFDFENLIP